MTMKMARKKMLTPAAMALNRLPTNESTGPAAPVSTWGSLDRSCSRWLATWYSRSIRAKSGVFCSLATMLWAWLATALPWLTAGGITTKASPTATARAVTVTTTIAIQRGSRPRSSRNETPWSMATAIINAEMVSVSATRLLMTNITAASTSSTPPHTVKTVVRLTCDRRIRRGEEDVTGASLYQRRSGTTSTGQVARWTTRSATL